jgi:GT2 family glycosyltransferase
MNTNKIPIPVLGIPHYNRPDLLARCLASIDHPVEHLVIVLQGPKDDSVIINDVGNIYGWPKSEMVMLKPMGKVSRDLVKKISFSTHPNAGVSGAWNEIIKLFPATWWLISNNDIQFTPGDLEKMANFVARDEAREDARPTGMVYGNHGASWFGITRQGVDTVGLFDENIFPAYLEDCDWSRRADLLGVRRCDVPDVHAIHGDDKLTGSCTVNENPELAEKNSRTHSGNFDYYRRKWGGLNGTEIFDAPFNEPQWPLWAWKFETDTRARQQW